MLSNDKDIDFSTILASAAHDMKNSLAMLLGSLTEITNQCDASTCPVHNKFRRLQHETQRVNRDLILLLTLYKLEQGQYFFNADEINLNNYLEEIILEYKDLLEGHGISMSLECEGVLTGYFDPNLISSVIKTIISNAYQYTNDNILISAKMVDGYININVIDNGPGYPQQLIYTDDTQRTGINFDTGSTGLGLYFSKKVAGLHKSKNKTGYIQIKNRIDAEGGCFSIYLP
jgi:signal transduction histidine kinase